MVNFVFCSLLSGAILAAPIGPKNPPTLSGISSGISSSISSGISSVSSTLGLSKKRPKPRSPEDAQWMKDWLAANEFVHGRGNAERGPGQGLGGRQKGFRLTPQASEIAARLTDEQDRADEPWDWESAPGFDPPEHGALDPLSEAPQESGFSAASQSDAIQASIASEHAVGRGKANGFEHGTVIEHEVPVVAHGA